MILHLKYFGMIEEATGCSDEKLQVDKLTVNQLTDVLISKYPELKKMSFQIAVNQEVKKNDFEINANCEVAILPPFAGG